MRNDEEITSCTNQLNPEKVFYTYYDGYNLRHRFFRINYAFQTIHFNISFNIKFYLNTLLTYTPMTTLAIFLNTRIFKTCNTFLIKDLNLFIIPNKIQGFI